MQKVRTGGAQVKLRGKNTTSLSSRITEILQERIADQKLHAGVRLHEQSLAEEFDTSRTVIREVLTALTQQGLVDRVPNRGAFVKGLSEKEILDIFDIREWLEAFLTFKAAENAPDGHWQRFIDQFGAPMRDSIASENIEPYNNLLEELRVETAVVAENEIANSFLYQVLDRARVIQKRITLLPGRAEKGREMHLSMLKCMAARDSEGAQQHKREIVTSARILFIKYKALIL